ncbi:hypothetical protein GCM10009105_23120 [Dokdonella soli]|uniref:Uncharacterized protein n=2 Tax=Dokdonella soli TaxID=529810 RepID=A0ABN1ILJ1_9GAMM
MARAGRHALPAGSRSRRGCAVGGLPECALLHNGKFGVARRDILVDRVAAAGKPQDDEQKTCAQTLGKRTDSVGSVADAPFRQWNGELVRCHDLIGVDYDSQASPSA